MYRRDYLMVPVGLALPCAGCIELDGGSATPVLELRAMDVMRAGDSNWRFTAYLRNPDGAARPFHDVTLLVFDERGNPLLEEPVGDIPGSESARVVTVDALATSFPAIQTATAEESPCNGARIEINYWVGTDEQRRYPPDDAVLWRSTDRQCDEPLPPQRVIDAVGTGDE